MQDLELLFPYYALMLTIVAHMKLPNGSRWPLLKAALLPYFNTFLGLAACILETAVMEYAGQNANEGGVGETLVFEEIMGVTYHDAITIGFIFLFCLPTALMVFSSLLIGALMCRFS